MILAFAGLVACGGGGFVKPTIGQVATPAAEIAAENNAFVFRAGQQFVPIATVYPCGLANDITPSSWKGFLQSGATPVRVKHPEFEGPLFGLLAFCNILPSAPASVQREYVIEIPAQRVEETSGGRVSVVYESYNAGNAAYSFPAWVLFLSRTSFSTPGSQ